MKFPGKRVKLEQMARNEFKKLKALKFDSSSRNQHSCEISLREAEE